MATFDNCGNGLWTTGWCEIWGINWHPLAISVSSTRSTYRIDARGFAANRAMPNLARDCYHRTAAAKSAASLYRHNRYSFSSLLSCEADAVETGASHLHAACHMAHVSVHRRVLDERLRPR